MFVWDWKGICVELKLNESAEKVVFIQNNRHCFTTCVSFLTRILSWF